MVDRNEENLRAAPLFYHQNRKGNLMFNDLDADDPFDTYAIESIFNKCVNNFKKDHFSFFKSKGQFALNSHRAIEATFFPRLKSLEIREIFFSKNKEHKVTTERFDFIFSKDHEANFAKFCLCFSDFRESIGR